MTEYYKVIEWRHRGCRCVLLRAEISRGGWRVIFPDYAGSQRTPGHWQPDLTPHKWTRFKRREERDRVWRLSLDTATWPPPGPLPGGYARDVDAANPDEGLPPEWRGTTMHVTVSCAHHSMREIDPHGTLTDLFRGDVEHVRTTRQPMFRELPLSSA